MIKQWNNLRLSKNKAAFEEDTESYLNYGFIATDDSYSSSLLCIIYSTQLFKKAIKPSKLLCHIKKSSIT